MTSICTTESLSSRIALDRQNEAFAREEARRQLQRAYRDNLYAAALRGKYDEYHTWADRHIVWDGKGGTASGPLRSVGEMLGIAFDLTDGPDIEDLIALAAAAARGEPVEQMAKELLTRAADLWAERRVEEELEDDE